MKAVRLSAAVFDHDDEVIEDEFIEDFPDDITITGFFDVLDDDMPLESRIVLALLKLYPDLWMVGSKDEQPDKPYKRPPTKPCAICSALTTTRFYLSPRVKFVLCRKHKTQAEILVVFNKGFFTRKNFLDYLLYDMFDLPPQ